MWRIGMWCLALAAGFVMNAGLGWSVDAPLTSTVLGKIHHSNLKGIEMGRLAQKNGRSNEVRQLGRTLVDDHTAADQKVVALASVELIDLPSHTLPLRPVETAAIPIKNDFDADFAKVVFDDCEEELTEESAARDDTGDEKLRALLDQRLPVLRAHRDTAKKILDEGGPRAEGASPLPRALQEFSAR
jgi:putative membrane protein